MATVNDGGITVYDIVCSLSVTATQLASLLSAFCALAHGHLDTSTIIYNSMSSLSSLQSTKLCAGSGHKAPSMPILNHILRQPILRPFYDAIRKRRRQSKDKRLCSGTAQFGA